MKSKGRFRRWQGRQDLRFGFTEDQDDPRNPPSSWGRLVLGMIKLTDADVDEPMNLGLAEADNVILGALGSVLDCGLEMGYINVEQHVKPDVMK